MSSTGKLKVTADIDKNRLYFDFIGTVTQKEMEGLYTDVRFCVADLKTGFHVISDFTECTLLQLSSIPALKKIMSYLIANGVSEIVRILQSDKVAHRQILNLATRVQGYKPIYVSDREEAEAELKNAVERKGLRVHLHQAPVDYIIDNEEGNGNIIDISTSGCAVEFTSLRPEVGGEVLLHVTFTKDDDSPQLFKIKAKVVRVDKTAFAAEFSDFDDESRELLWECLIRESRR